MTYEYVMLTSPRRVAVLSFCLFVRTAAPSAMAAQPESPSGNSGTPKHNLAPPPEALAAGRAFFEKGQAYYSAGKYQAAWVEFSSAFQIIELPDLLFNIARCEAKMGRKDDAARHFRQFLAANPSDPDADGIRKQIDELEGRSSQPVERSSMRRVPWIATVTGGAGLLLVLGGAGAIGAANSTYYSLQTSCGTACTADAVSVGRTQSAVGYSLLAIGFAAMATAAVVVPIELKKMDARPKLALSLSLSSLAFQGSF